jgi:hypothetical protein
MGDCEERTSAREADESALLEAVAILYSRPTDGGEVVVLMRRPPFL